MARIIEPLTIGRVVGDVVDNFAPSVRMNVIYNSNKQVANGHELMPSVIVLKPHVEIGGDDLRTAYTLVINLHTIYTLVPIFPLYIYQCS